jgi:hypothetical protein
LGCVLAAVVAGLGTGCGDDEPPGGGRVDAPEVPIWSAQTATGLIPRGSVWRYLDDGSDQGTAWRAPAFNDASWRFGPAQLGYGDGDEATTVGFGPSALAKYTTTYFRRAFTITDASRYTMLTLRLLRDDGAVVYLNGIEVFRTNMPAGTITAATLAPEATPDENILFEVAIDTTSNPSLLHNGTNVLAVEVHQSWPTSSDISFDAELSGEPLPAPVPPGTTALIARNANWRYLDDGSDQGTAWRALAFGDGAWRVGPAQLGYGDGDEATVIGFGPSADAKHITSYFRHTFLVDNASRFSQLTLRLLRDDGAVAYLNGVEVFRSNLPAGAVGATTLALAATPEENRFFDVAIDTAQNPSLLQNGANVLAVEVHQSWPTSSDVSFDAELIGQSAAPVPVSRHIDRYLVNYSTWSADEIAVAKRHQLVVAHPRSGQLTRSVVAEIQRGVDGVAGSADDVRVVCYVSIGEDLRSGSVSDAQARVDPRFVGDGAGPRVDPRGPDADGRSLAGIDPRGLPSRGGVGFASFYLDDNSVDRNGVGDGIPDRNARFGAYFVNAGDPRWFEVIDLMTLDSPDGVSGLRESMTTSHGRGLGCDGVFLDTLDTAAPNHYTNAGSFNQSEFEWTAPGFSDFVRRLRAAYPGKLVVQNRGVFFLDPRHPHYAFSTRGVIDFLMFESYRLDSNSTALFDPYFYPDNRFNIAPKLLAEAGRGSGFQVLSLGYAEGPSNLISRDTLVGRSTLGFGELIEDIRVTQDLVGFRHYLTDGAITLVNAFVLDNSSLADFEAPVWTSSYNDRNPGFPAAPGEPTPRVGIRQVLSGPRQLTLRWDVARDKHPVGYVAYHRTTPFDFAADPQLRSATRVEIVPTAPVDYAGFGGPFIVANEATIGGLAPNQTHYVVIRAFDRSPARNEDQNQVVLTGVPTP